ADEPLLKALAQNAPLENDAFRWLIQNGYAQDAAQNPAVSSELLDKLALHQDSKLRSGAAANKNTPKGRLSQLAEDKDPLVRRNAAKNPNTAADKLLSLAKDRDELTRSAILDNPNLTQLALDAVEPVYEAASCDNRAKIYAGPCVGSAQLIYHKKNPDPCVRRGIAQNPNTPEDVLVELALDADPQTKRAALSNPALKNYDFQNFFPVGWLSDENVENKVVRKALLENPNIPPGLLKSAALNKPSEFGVSVAKNPNTPKPILNALFNYAAERGGVAGFLDEAAAIADDRGFLSKTFNNNNLKAQIKSRIQDAFQRNIYDPLSLVRLMRDDAHKAASPIADVNEDLTLEDFEKGGEFFEDKLADSELTLEENLADFGEFFDDKNPFEVGMLETADRIVAAVVDAVTPIVEERLAAPQNNTAPIVAVNGVNSADAVNSGNAAAAIPVQTPQPSADRTLFSPKLYQQTCKEVEDLRFF
ncbi:MAG: HEAT repeat domain-containing protein, partial [Deferribacteraceae bacterium]|nr:HEAT repeat domain-containing protein [Deferribacteraceae bacterium]